MLSAGDRHHLERVLRLRNGDTLTVSDGMGGWRRCRFGIELRPEGPRHQVDRAEPVVTVAFALVKGGRPELVVQKLTEVGVDRIVPFVAARSVVRLDDDRADRRAGRLAQVAREAAMQSRRCHLPAVDAVTDFPTVAALSGAAVADRDGDPPTLANPTLLVGPEGGWTDEERRRGLPAVHLGGHVLRSETAAIVGGWVLCALRMNLLADTLRAPRAEGG
jgi:16S rRNA (uracil1498-N3)-methyltransferase